MMMRLASALAYGILVGLLCLLGGQLLASVGGGPFDVLGHWLSAYAWVLGIIAAIIAYAGSWSIPGTGPRS